MTYAGQFLNLEWGFTTTSVEVAYTGLNVTSVAPAWAGAVAALGELETADIGQNLISDMGDLMSTAACQWADYSTLSNLKISARSTTGAYLTDPLVYEADPSFVGDSQQILPQSTIVLSLRSGFTLGRANYGRMYLPHTKVGQAAGHIEGDTAAAAAVAAAGSDFVNSVIDRINDEVTAVLQAAIMSAVGAGTTRGVTTVGVGVITDTQRRRRNKLAENYQFSPLV